MSWESAAKEWERLGRTDPYWAVISDDAYRAETFSGERLAAFLKTGEDDVDRMWRTCRLVFGADFAPRRVLDFGCGVGRVALPLARRVANVVAADAADSMLSIARDVLARHGVGNVQLVKCDRELSGLDGPFDLVHSVLVLQHIPAGRGLWLTKRLVELAGRDGAVVLHVLYRNPYSRPAPVRFAHRLLHPFRGWFGRPPEIQMNEYSLNAVLKIVHDAGARQVHVELTDHGGHLGAALFFRCGRSS